MTMRSRNPQSPRASDQPLKKAYTEYYGMLTGEPASELPAGYSALNKNVIDKGEYYDVRNGSRPYTTFKLGITIQSVDVSGNTLTLSNVHQWTTGDIVWFRGTGLPGPLQEDTAYYCIKVTNKVVKIATTYANSIAGKAINIIADKTDDSWIYYGEINAQEDHISNNVVLMLLGNSVYAVNKRMNNFMRVLNIDSVDPTGVSTIFIYDTDAVLFSSTGIFKIVLSDSKYWMMFQINKELPTAIITDINETALLTYGYLYFYSMATIEGSGNRSRLDHEILFESGTAQRNTSGKDYGEVFFATEPGIVLSENHSVGTMTLPGSVNGITHFPLYRTRNIGENSGGAGTSISSIGNKRDFPIWIADVPVAKAFILNTTTPGVTTIVSGNKFVYGDSTCILKDTAGNTATISAYTDENTVAVGAGLASGTAICCAIGGGRVIRCSQVGTVVTRDAGDVFATTDKGLLLFLSDGSTRHIVRYLTADTAEVLETGDFTNYAGTMKPVSGNFSRKWNDTVPDDPQGDGRVSWEDFSLYGSDLYIPRRFFLPVPNSNIGVINNGFVFCATRGGSRYYYSQIGDKDYSMGYYVNPNQSKKISGSITHIVMFPSKVIILTDKTTVEIVLSSSSNVGRTSVGENIFELSAANTIDPQRGVKAWRTVVFKNASLMFALCSDSSYRPFNGNAWGEDLAIINGKDAVSKEYLKLADQSYGVNSFYSNFSGAKLWFRKWSDLKNSGDREYEMVQLTWTPEDTNEQLSWDTFEDRAQIGNRDMQSTIL